MASLHGDFDSPGGNNNFMMIADDVSEKKDRRGTRTNLLDNPAPKLRGTRTIPHGAGRGTRYAVRGSTQPSTSGDPPGHLNSGRSTRTGMYHQAQGIHLMEQSAMKFFRIRLAD